MCGRGVLIGMFSLIAVVLSIDMPLIIYTTGNVRLLIKTEEFDETGSIELRADRRYPSGGGAGRKVYPRDLPVS
jgi:hypothetical protein